jgi:hypothetical protein
MLQETKCCGGNAKTILRKVWRNAQAMIIDSRGVAGGLTILWNLATIILDNFFATERILSTQFRLIGLSKNRFLTNVYGPQRIVEKYTFLQNLINLADVIENHH